MKYGKSKVLICEIMGFVSISWKEQHPGGLLANSEGKNVLRNLMRIPYRRLKAGFFCVLKEKRIIPSVSGGIKSFEHFQRGEYFSDCSFDSFVSWFRLLSPGWSELKPAIFFISKYFFTCPDLFPLQNQLYPSLRSKNHFVRRKTFSEIEGQ